MSKKTPLIKLQPCHMNIDSEYGRLSYKDWCTKEIKRLEPLWPRCHIIYETKNNIKCCGIREKGGSIIKKKREE